MLASDNELPQLIRRGERDVGGAIQFCDRDIDFMSDPGIDEPPQLEDNGSLNAITLESEGC